MLIPETGYNALGYQHLTDKDPATCLSQLDAGKQERIVKRNSWMSFISFLYIFCQIIRSGNIKRDFQSFKASIEFIKCTLRQFLLIIFTEQDRKFMRDGISGI